MSLNQYEKTALFNSIFEAEKKLEASRHFQETGKMVSFIAHELRSPLSSILFNMEVIKDSINKKKEIDGEYLDISLKEVKRLNETVEKMLTYGRNIKLSVSEGTFADFFQEIEHIFFNDSRKINFDNQTGSKKFNFDWDALKSIFINVINNSLQAIERSGIDGSVTVTVKKTRTRIMITISDSGPGIPEEHRTSIFEPFYTTRKDGNGLGLATCEKIVKLSGGTIKLKETSVKGTTFEIILPIS
jgi:signal transduction histidine kinase